ncbi:hypothetical protein ONE63_005142 [Megalurothrips usitatus]|uniref:RNA-directed DNA polymerase n=1 Tax=Megalurothrips usitatus TaxID=439358 RepID=A0AAV7XVG8_9NEOP|nr:hypothetical protein ONE63_005142 [Megalurothrips usitatus]
MDGVLVGWGMLVDPDDDTIWVTNISDEEVLVMPGLKFGFLRNDLQLRAPKKRQSMKLLQYLRNQFTPRFGGNIFTVQEGEPAEEEFDINPELPEEDRKAIRAMLKNNSDVFMKENEPLRTTSIMKVRLPLKDDGKVIYQHNYSLSPVQDKAASEVIQKMLQERVLEPAPHSNYRIPFFLVEKGKDKNDVMQYRLVLSAKKLNECFANINYAPPKIPHILAQLKGKTLFSTLDLSSSFHQLEIDERDRHILTIQHKGQLFRYRSLPQGLSISSQFLCSALTLALDKTLFKCTINYVDDTIVYSEGRVKEHIESLDLVLGQFRKANFGINRKKCKFAYPKISFLGHITSGEEYYPDPRKFRELEKLLTAKNRAQARSIFCYYSHYRTFIKDFHKISKPVLDAADPKAKFEWGPDQINAVTILHKMLIDNVALMHFDPDRDTIVTVDGSPVYGCGAVLLQKCPKTRKFRPVSIHSKQFPKSQRKISAHDAELLALYYALQKFRMELHAVQSFEIHSDCNGLQHLTALPHPSSRQARVMLYLSQFHGKYKIKYKPGREQVCPDFHSRSPDPIPSYDPHDEEFDAWKLPDEEPRNPEICKLLEQKSIELLGSKQDTSITAKYLEERQSKEENNFAVTRGMKKREEQEGCKRVAEFEPRHLPKHSTAQWEALLQKEQMLDASLQPVLTALKNGQEKKGYKLKDGLLYRAFPPKMTRQIAVMVPNSLRGEVLKMFHDSIWGNHYGVQKTLALMKKSYFWQSMETDTRNYVASCELCAKFKPKLKKAGLMQPIKSSTPFKKMGIDFVEYVKSKQGNKYAVVLIDLFSSFIYAIPTKRCRAVDAVKALKQIIPFIAIPEVLICDSGSHFTCDAFRDFVNKIGIKQLNVIPPDVHFCNGAAEAAIKKVNHSVRMFCGDDLTQWDEHLPFALNVVNSSILKHGKSPLELIYGISKEAPGVPLVREEDEESGDEEKEISRFCAKRKEKLQAEQKKMFDRNRKEEKYEENEEIYYEVKPRSKFGFPEKLQQKFRKGRIVRRDSEVTYTVRPLEGRSKRLIRVHVSQIKPCVKRKKDLA